jgi:hypothetical protein
MVSLLFLSLVCFELFAAVSATKPLLQRTPRRYSPIKRKLDTRLSGLLVFGRQNGGGPCCADGGLSSRLTCDKLGIILTLPLP